MLVSMGILEMEAELRRQRIGHRRPILYINRRNKRLIILYPPFQFHIPETATAAEAERMTRSYSGSSNASDKDTDTDSGEDYSLTNCDGVTSDTEEEEEEDVIKTGRGSRGKKRKA